MNLELLNRLIDGGPHPMGAIAMGMIYALESSEGPIIPDSTLYDAVGCTTLSQALALYANIKAWRELEQEKSLKPCPFCGSGNLKSGYRDGVGYVDCRNCHTTCDFYHGNALIERWNRRTPPEMTAEQQINGYRAEHGVIG